MQGDKIKIYGLIGYPLEHSLSPLMHNSCFSYLKIKAEYRLFPLKEEELEGFLKNLRQKNIFGLNVTIPYKEKVIPYLNWISSEAKFIGAVNTIVVSKNNFLKGYNTDSSGFYRHLVTDLKFKIKGKNILILGAGGASKAISVKIVKDRPKSLFLYDIDKKKAKDLADKLNNQFRGILIRYLDSLEQINTNDINLLINATGCGLKPDDPLPIKEDFIHKNMFVYDLIYNPAKTKLLEVAEKKGAKISNGLGMLLYQGVSAFRYFTGRNASVKVMREALNHALYTKKL